jgi:cell division protein FtsI/penicillin-binding protein 2
MRAAVEVGTARRVGQLATAHQLAAKTGTAEAALADGTPATLSWITVAVDDRYVITIAVQPTNDQPHPAPEHAALNVAARIVQALDTPPAPPTCS